MATNQEKSAQVVDIIVGGPSTAKTPAGAETIHPAGNRFGVRYDELAMFISAGFEARLAALEGS